MTLINTNPLATMPRFFDSYLLKDMEIPGVSSNSMRSSVPAVNIKETKAGFELEMAVPGLEKKDISIEVDKNLLTISSVKKEKEGEEKKEEKYRLREFKLPSFKRSFKLPEKTVDIEKIEASYTNGILKLSFPKKEEVKLQPKQIEIS